MSGTRADLLLSAHDHFPAFPPVIINGEVREDRILSILSGDGEQYPYRAYPVVTQAILDRRLHPEGVEPIPSTDVDRLAVSSPREPMESDEFEVITGIPARHSGCVR